MAEAKSFNGNYLLLRVPGDKHRVLLFECLIPYVKPSSAADWLNFKFPMFFVAFFLVLIY